jgi:hypothetical protein
VHVEFGEKLLMQDKPVLLRLHIGSPYHKDKFIKHTIEEIEKHLANQRNLPILLNCQFKNWQRQINLLENQEILYGGKSIKTFTLPYFTE